MGFDIYSFYGWLQPGFREKRIRLFLDLFRPSATTSILDIGGTIYDWQDVPVSSSITVLNVGEPGPPAELPPRVIYKMGDGRQLPYPDQSFDIVYSNSVIEHLRTYEDQRRFAEEAQRVGRNVFVQTPHRWFPIEPHFVTLFLHYLPKKAQRLFLPRLSLRGLIRSGDNANLEQLFEETRLLSIREMRDLFPACEIHREKMFGLTKSLIAVGLESSKQPA